MHHAQTQIQKTSVMGEKCFVACFLNGIPSGDYHWIVHVKDPTTFEEVVKIVRRYHRTSKKDHNKPEFAKTLWDDIQKNARKNMCENLSIYAQKMTQIYDNRNKRKIYIVQASMKVLIFLFNSCIPRL